MKKLSPRVGPAVFWLVGLLSLVMASGAPHKLESLGALGGLF